ncbi:MAG: cardiolipin synthase [Oscillospiraceae bacterium]|nr:cardiolipin synthase [Oscillospiraceae bacterium]
MENEENVVRLAKPRKKGLLHLIFSRFFVIALLLALQVAIIVVAYVFFMDKVPYLVGVVRFFSLIMVLYLFNCPMDSSAKLTWMFIIAIAPLLGTGFLFFTQSNLGHRMEREMFKKQISLTKDTLEQPMNVIRELEHDGSGTDDLCRYLKRSGCFPLYDHTEVTYFPSGEEKFKAMLEEMEKAEKFIFMEYFIVEEGYMWGRILDVLTRKAKEGVEVRVMYDGMCEMSTLPADYWKLLEKAGVRSKPFSPIKPFVSTHYNYRDHRKILVIDNKVAFNGGVNLADEYINRIERFGHWKDTAVMLKGPAVRSFTLLFLQMWNIGEKNPDYDTWLGGEEPEQKEAQGYVMPYGDNPLDEYKVGETVYMDILNRATDYVHIMTPYLILDDELETALKYAAQRGVDVKMILPGIPDKKIVYALAKTHYKELLEAGVQIYEYTPGFVHAKVFVSDDARAVVGTINLDYRSLYHHFECATYLYKAACIPEIEADFQETLTKCREVTRETIKKESLFTKIAGPIAKLVAPLL